MIIPERKLSIILLIIGTIGISFGGLIMRSVSTADSWQIIFYRALSFVITFSFVLFYKYRNQFFSKILKTGIYGFLGGIIYMIGNLFFLHSFANTTIGNTLFTVSTIPFITAIISYIFLNEKIKKENIVIILVSLIGILIILNDSIISGDLIGILFALLCALFFSFYILILRKSKHIDMIPAGLLGGIFIVIVSFIFKKGDIFIDFNDILLCFLWGAILNGFMNLVFIFSTRHLLASEVTFFMLIEFCLGPIWVWFYFDESLSTNSLVGGLIILFCVSVFTFKEIKRSQKFI